MRCFQCSPTLLARVLPSGKEQRDGPSFNHRNDAAGEGACPLIARRVQMTLEIAARVKPDMARHHPSARQTRLACCSRCPLILENVEISIPGAAQGPTPSGADAELDRRIPLAQRF